MYNDDDDNSFHENENDEMFRQKTRGLQVTYKSVELDSQNCIGITVVTDLSSLLEVTHFELAR